MELPFTVQEFFEVFESYNTAIWPAHVIAYALGACAVYFAVRPSRTSTRYILLTLAVFWLWMGAVYHLMFFSSINKAAYVFGLLFLVQGVLFLKSAVSPSLVFTGYKTGLYSGFALAFILYAMLIYPLIGHALGHGYPLSPSFGVAPCPTTIFTFGILLLTGDKVSVYLFAIPALWSLIGFSAAFTLGVVEDYGLVLAGAAGGALLIYRNKRLAANAAW